jgi:TonB family protein
MSVRLLSGCSGNGKQCKIRGRVTEPADMAERIIPNPKLSGLQSPSSGHESDLRELAALFAEHSGGSFSAEVAADLALDIVLGEIVEQAGHATGATGAAILLEREGELVCRASRGSIAPEMGARLSSRTGLTGECIRMREVLRCDDALIDSRADTEASRALSVRSVVIVPLLRDSGLAGVLEIFSHRAEAFDERDEIMLEALAVRTLKNLDRAREVAEGLTAHAPEVVAPVASVGEDHAQAIAANHFEEAAVPESFGPAVELEKKFEEAAEAERVEPTSPEVNLPEKEDAVVEEALEQNPPHGMNIVTVALVAAIVICAVLLATLVGLRISGRRASGEPSRVMPSAPRAATRQTNATSIQGETPAAAPSAGSPNLEAKKDSVKSGGTTSAHSPDSVPPEGGLSVYENGKEVFRMPPGAQPASSEPKGIVEVSEEPTHRVEPEYPESARQQGIQGPVVLDVRIGRDGAVQDVKVLSGPRVLADAAIAAVKRWKFQPQSVDGQTRVTLNFKMTQ